MLHMHIVEYVHVFHNMAFNSEISEYGEMVSSSSEVKEVLTSSISFSSDTSRDIYQTTYLCTTMDRDNNNNRSIFSLLESSSSPLTLIFCSPFPLLGINSSIGYCGGDATQVRVFKVI